MRRSAFASRSTAAIVLAFERKRKEHGRGFIGIRRKTASEMEL
jgi:hypothetical protein